MIFLSIIDFFSWAKIAEKKLDSAILFRSEILINK